MVTGDGHDGYSAKAPYDVIHVGRATPTVPQALYDQLKCGGRMIIPVGPQEGSQYLEQHDKKSDGSIVIEEEANGSAIWTSAEILVTLLLWILVY